MPKTGLFFGNLEDSVERSAEDRGLLCGILLGSKNSLRAICIALFGLITCGSGQLQLKNQL